jgi:hypothetical protein
MQRVSSKSRGEISRLFPQTFGLLPLIKWDCQLKNDWLEVFFFFFGLEGRAPFSSSFLTVRTHFRTPPHQHNTSFETTTLLCSTMFCFPRIKGRRSSLDKAKQELRESAKSLLHKSSTRFKRFVEFLDKTFRKPTPERDFAACCKMEATTGVRHTVETVRKQKIEKKKKAAHPSSFFQLGSHW